MENLKQAVIETDGRIRCPVCFKVNGIVTNDAILKNYKIRCRTSRRGHEHFFVVNWNGGISKND